MSFLRSPERRVLLATQFRELRASRAFLVVAALLGPLVAHAARTAMQAYAEASGVGGGAAALTSALSPLDGFVSPTFGAYAVAAMLLFPFVAIRVVSADKESGAHGIVLQAASARTIVALKFIALLVTWIVLFTPGIIALLYWRGAGGHLGPAETLGVLAGHVLRGAFVSALGIACAAVAESGASAAVIALAVTIGGWAIDFTASVQGGWVAEFARFTPDAALRNFERGIIESSVIVVSVLVIAALLAVAALWLDPARSMRARLRGLALIVFALSIGLDSAGRLRSSWDVSEDRRNSFSDADAAALRAIGEPLRIEVNLGPEDPRLTDLERGVFSKLRRTMRDVQLTYTAQTSTGLFEGSSTGYGDVTYHLGGRSAVSKSSIPQVVLETIYGLAQRTPPVAEPNAYPGYPATFNAGVTELIVLVLVWPLLIVAVCVAPPRRRSP